MFPGNGKNGRAVLRSQRYPMLTLFDEVNRFFEEAVPVAQSAGRASSFSPPIDVTENEKEYLLRGEFPGLNGADINIELRENTLTLSGEKRQDRESTEGTRHWVERSFGSFSRTVRFEVEVDEDNAHAEMKDGILTIKVPKAAKEIKGTKKLSIKCS